MADNNTGLLLGLAGIGIAVVVFLMGGGGSGPTGGSSSGPSSRENVFADNPGFLEQLREAASGSGPSGSSGSGDGQGFAEEIVNRTGFLPSGFDAADRVRLIGGDDFQDDYQTGDGAVGL